MFRLKAIPLAASSSVPIRPTMIMNSAKAATSSEYWSPVGIPKRTSRATSHGSSRQPASVRYATRCRRCSISARKTAAPATCDSTVPSAAPVTPSSGKPALPKISR